MQRLWYTLLDNLVLLQVVFPLLGGVLVLLLGRRNEETARQMAVSNAGLTLVLTLVMVGQFDTRIPVSQGLSSSLQMDSSFVWVHGRQPQAWPEHSAPALMPDVRIACGIDGISLWLVSLTAVLTFAVIAFEPVPADRRQATFLAGVLFLEASVIGVLTALDAVLFGVWLNVSLLLTTWLIARSGGSGRRIAARRYLKANLAGNLLLLVGLAGLVAEVQAQRSMSVEAGVHVSLSIPALVDEVPQLTLRSPLALARWQLVRSLVFVALLLGIAIRLPVFLFHGWFLPVIRESTPAVKALVCGTGGMVGLYCWLRLVVPVFPENCLAAVEFLTALAILGILYFAVSTLAAGDLHLGAGYAWLAHVNWALLAGFSFDAIGVQASLLYLCANGLCAALLYLALPMTGRTRSGSSAGWVGTLTDRDRLFGGLAVCAFLGIPGLSLFSTGLATTLAVSRWSVATAVWGMLAGVILAWGVLVRYQRAVRIEHQLQWTEIVPVRHGLLARVLSGGTRLALIVLTVVNLLIGLTPQFFVDRIAPAAVALLRSYPQTTGTP